MASNRRRVVITGVGVVSPVGTGKTAFWTALCAGTPGVKRISRFEVEGFSCTAAGEVDDFDAHRYIPPKRSSRMDRFTRFGVAASLMAIRDAGLGEPLSRETRVGIALGSALGGIPAAEAQHTIFLEKGARRLDPALAIRLFPGALASQTAIELGVQGPNLTVSTACAAGAMAIAEGVDFIRGRRADVVVAGGAEAPLSPLTLAAFCNIRALSKDPVPERASKPFDRQRDGFVMSEGAGVVVLESLGHARRRGARIYAEAAGYGTSNDAYHMTRPLPDGSLLARAIRDALDDAGTPLEEIDYISAHGSSTPLNDRTETLAVKQVFGRRAWAVPMSSLKSMTGHPLGAGGAVEFLAAALTIDRGFIPPTINYRDPDPECDLDYVPGQGRAVAVRAVLSNSMGFGGSNVAHVLKACKPPPAGS